MSEDSEYYRSLPESADLPTVSIATIFNELFRQFAVLSSLRHSITIISSTGILTRCPSTTLFSLALGPDLPSADEPSGGNLGFSGYRILTYIFVTQADILTSASSISTFVNTSTYNRTLPYRYKYRTVSANYLSPVHFRRRLTRSVSYYALFKGLLLLSKPPDCFCTPTTFAT